MTEAALAQGDMVGQKMNKMFDDMKGLTDPKNWTASKICGMVSSVLFLTVFIVLTFYLGSYGYNNPDPSECWIIKGLDAAQTSRAAVIQKATDASVTVPEGYPVEMHKVYRAWALWGFWTNMVLFGSLFLSMVLVCFKPAWAAITSSIGGLGFLISTLLWLVFGAIWRYSTGGSIAAGDKLVREDGVSDDDWKATLEASSAANGYQIKNGKFLSLVFGIVSAVLVLVLIGFAVAGCLMCVCGMDKDSIGNLTKNPMGDDKDNEDENKPLAQDDGTEQERQLGINSEAVDRDTKIQ